MLLEHRRTEREIWYKMAVHDVYMQHDRATPFNASDLLGQMGKIRRKDRWNNLNHLACKLPRSYHSGEKAVPGLDAWYTVHGMGGLDAA